eukprot:scaffold2222_cov28-Tisochrysis_lutea.AAC.3
MSILTFSSRSRKRATRVGASIGTSAASLSGRDTTAAERTLVAARRTCGTFGGPDLASEFGNARQLSSPMAGRHTETPREHVANLLAPSLGHLAIQGLLTGCKRDRVHRSRTAGQKRPIQAPRCLLPRAIFDTPSKRYRHRPSNPPPRRHLPSPLHRRLPRPSRRHRRS